MRKLKYLTPEQKEFYTQNGFVKISGVFSNEEFDEMAREYDDIFDRKSKEDMDGLETSWIGDDMKKAANNINYTVKSIHNLHMHSYVFNKMLTNKKMLDAVEDILDTEDILLHHCKAHVKPPEKGAPYLMHQDYPYFPHKKHTMIAVFIHFDDTTPENGGLCVYPGSHKLGPLKNRELVDENGDIYRYCDPEKYPLEKAVPVTAKRGEIIVFSYLLLHGSYLNLSNRCRRMYLLQLRAADDEPVMDGHHSHCQGLVLRGKNTRFRAHKSTRFTDKFSNS